MNGLHRTVQVNITNKTATDFLTHSILKGRHASAQIWLRWNNEDRSNFDEKENEDSDDDDEDDVDDGGDGDGDDDDDELQRQNVRYWGIVQHPAL